MRKIYTVQAFRWGDLDGHSYIVGVYENEEAAIKTAESETTWRSGKYRCCVREWTPRSIACTDADNAPGMPSDLVYMNIDEKPYSRRRQDGAPNA